MISRRRPGAAATAPIDLQAVDRDGYATTSIFTRAELAAVRRELDRFGLDDDHDFFASPAFSAGEPARAFDLAVRSIARPALHRLLPDHEPFMIAATTKGRRSTMPVKFHQDWTYTDEPEQWPVFLWCPLVDVDERNGALRVIPGSNHWTTAIRPSRRDEATEAHQAEFAARARTIALRAGQALAFAPSTLHGSEPNPTDRPRPAITIALAPRGARLVHFHESSDGALSGAVVDDAFFTMHPYGTAPVGYPPLSPWDRAVVPDDYASALHQSSNASAS